MNVDQPIVPFRFFVWSSAREYSMKMCTLACLHQLRWWFGPPWARIYTSRKFESRGQKFQFRTFVVYPKGDRRWYVRRRKRDWLLYISVISQIDSHFPHSLTCLLAISTPETEKPNNIPLLRDKYVFGPDTCTVAH